MNRLKFKRCPVCTEEDSDSIIDGIYDDRYGYPGVFILRKCNVCDHIFLDASFSESQLSNLYSKFYPRSTFDLENYHPHQERHGMLAWLDGAQSSAYRWIPTNCKVLDIGCGFGETLGYHKTRGCDVYGVEADENVKRVAEKYNYNVHIGLFDPEKYPSSYFDYVTLDQVLEHVQNPVEVLQGVAQILKPGGMAILSVPNAHGWGARLFRRRWINWHVPYHMQFYSTQSMRLALEKVGLELEQTDTVTSSSWLNYQWLHLLTYPPEGVVSKFWEQKGKYSLTQKVANKLLSIIHRAKINHLITRVFDAMGFGDNRLFIVRKP
jgi:2-polyprenyl-3-methyl-5-hydroxy-6-metoxy-1,4-benzoquinol methylase